MSVSLLPSAGVVEPNPGVPAGDSLAALLELEDLAEDRHFWFRGRLRVIGTLAAQLVAGLAPGYRVVELGAGNGSVLRTLQGVCSKGFVAGMDVSVDGLRRARRRTTCPLVCGDVRLSPFARPFHLVGLFDVLEHLPDDAEVLAGIYSMLEPGGALLLTVPADTSLWSHVDEASGHYRRYERGELVAKLEAAGFVVEYATAFMAPIHPLMWLGRRLASFRASFAGGGDSPADKLRMAASELRVVPGLNGLLTAALFAEAKLIARRRTLPIGTSLIAIARRKNTER
jgi:SAM-dependent methyltransferase